MTFFKTNIFPLRNAILKFFLNKSWFLQQWLKIYENCFSKIYLETFCRYKKCILVPLRDELLLVSKEMSSLHFGLNLFYKFEAGVTEFNAVFSVQYTYTVQTKAVGGRGCVSHSGTPASNMQNTVSQNTMTTSLCWYLNTSSLVSLLYTIRLQFSILSRKGESLRKVINNLGWSTACCTRIRSAQVLGQ